MLLTLLLTNDPALGSGSSFRVSSLSFSEMPRRFGFQVLAYLRRKAGQGFTNTCWMVLGVLFAFSLFNHNHSFLSLTHTLLLSDPQFSLGCQEWHQGAIHGRRRLDGELGG